MAAGDHLSDEQFFKAKNGRQYRLEVDPVWRNNVTVTPVDRKRPVGYVSWIREGFHTPGPEVHKAVVKEPHRRLGLASAMFDFASQHAPGLQHSKTLSPDGKAFAEAHPARPYDAS